MSQLVRLSQVLRNVAPRSWVRLVAVLALGGVAACGDRSASATGEIECVRIDVADLALSEDPACTVASEPVTLRFLPDLSFTPGLCYQTGFVPLALTAADGRTFELRIAAFSGIVGNPIAGAAIAPLPAPPYIAFTAASAIRVESASGEAVGQIAARDTGWAEIGSASTLPKFVSERLAFVGTSGELLKGAVGEVIAAGDEFVGIPAHGSLCAPGLLARLAAHAG